MQVPIEKQGHMSIKMIFIIEKVDVKTWMAYDTQQTLCYFVWETNRFCDMKMPGSIKLTLAFSIPTNNK